MGLFNALPRRGPPMEFSIEPQTHRKVHVQLRKSRQDRLLIFIRRTQPGTKPTLIRNATIWTGKGNGTVVVSGDILLGDWIIKAVEYTHDIA